MTGKPRILLVDDEPHVLQGLCLQLGRRYQVAVALSGNEALAELQKHEAAPALERLRNFAQGTVQEPIAVKLPKRAAQSSPEPPKAA